jgi:hypothetical protein
MKLTSTLSIELVSELELLEISPGFTAYARTVTPKRTSQKGGFRLPKNSLSLPPEFGLVDDANKEKMLRGVAFKKLDLVAVPAAQLEELRTRGWEDTVYELAHRSVIEAFQADPSMGPDNLVRLDFGSHMVFDRHNHALPVGLVFDYISSHIDESSYNLDAVASHLLARPDVDVFDGHLQRGALGAQTTLAVSSKKAIFDIPYYNSAEGRTQSVQFFWKPTLEDYRAMWDHHLSRKPSHPGGSLRYDVLEIDLLGLNACRHPEPSAATDSFKGLKRRQN